MTPRVLHIDTGKSWRGGQQQAMYLYKSMLNEGYQTNICVTTNSKFAEKLKYEKLEHYELQFFGELDILSARKIAQIAREGDFNIIHCHCSHSLTIAVLATIFNQKIKIIATRRVDFPINLNFFTRAKYLNKNVKKIVCISDAIRKVLLNCGFPPEILTTIYSGIELDKYKDSDGSKIRDRFPGKIIVGTIAALAGHKNYPFLLKTASLLKNKNVIFIALGDGELMDEMKRKAKELNLDNFYFEGYQENVGEYLKAFDIFVLASKKEGLGTSILDAMAVGLPIVATNVGGIPEAVQDGVNGYLVPLDNPEFFSNRIELLASDLDLCKKFGGKSREIVKKFDIKKTVEENIKLYFDVLSE